MNETERVYSEMTTERFPTNGITLGTNEAWAAELLSRVHTYEALTEILCALFVTGCYWGEAHHNYLWTQSLKRLAHPAGGNDGLTHLLSLRRYPVLRLTYAGGIAALAGDRYHTFASLLTVPQVQQTYERDAVPLALGVYPSVVLERDVARLLPKMERHHTPVSDWLFDTLREPLRSVVPDDQTYQSLFDRFEYLLALVHADLYQRLGKANHIWGPVGCFGWRYRYNPEHGIASVIHREIEAQQEAWPLLQTGLFTSSLDRLRAVKKDFDERLAQSSGGWF